MTRDELTDFLRREFPQVADEVILEDVDAGGVTMRLRVSTMHLRPGNTVSGPAIFMLADVAFYAAVLARVGPKALAVTTNCAIDFMRRPPAGHDLTCRARLLKLGRRLAVGDALVYSEGAEGVVARAGLTYALPPER